MQANRKTKKTQKKKQLKVKIMKTLILINSLIISVVLIGVFTGISYFFSVKIIKRGYKYYSNHMKFSGIILMLSGVFCAIISFGGGISLLHFMMDIFKN